MTFCKVLAIGKRGDEDITAYEKTEKFSSVSNYEIVVSRDSIAIEVIKTARTTWKKRFSELVGE